MPQLEGGGTAPLDNEHLRSLDTRVFMDRWTRISGYYMQDIYFILDIYVNIYFTDETLFTSTTKLMQHGEFLFSTINFSLTLNFPIEAPPSFSVSDVF